ncbi:MAG: SUMF1/EgtB/PvdO family nonheme iron enzyme [Myxococcales bacterium]|nr:SUMF1/EgtB/PvdO family nonheme iron enzyme [Polyangiaceae bacterium]MDW8247999.1 SUMF1/EgtB/PvdO family nonheme iron enzyme [Myxococcales bacterium]
MRKHLTAAFLAGAALHGAAYLMFQRVEGSRRLELAHLIGQGVVLDLLGCARRLSSALMSPRSAAASTAVGASWGANPATSTLAPSPKPEPEDHPAVVEGRASSAGDACPAGMILVEGEYCPEVEHTCAKWLETTGRYKYFRCAEYTGARCLSKQREHRRFCIDRDEYVPPGEHLPVSHVSWTDAQNTCQSLGKRVCLESEWNFACEGEEMRPYPYGWKRDPDACNADRVDIYKADGSLRDLRVGSEDKPRCVSPFGVHNLSGNLEEWTTLDASAKIGAPRPAMKGAYWQPSRNHCRAAQTAHDRFYKGTETGFRCCADAR